jgi:hypothetical protein
MEKFFFWCAKYGPGLVIETIHVLKAKGLTVAALEEFFKDETAAASSSSSSAPAGQASPALAAAVPPGQAVASNPLAPGAGNAS